MTVTRHVVVHSSVYKAVTVTYTERTAMRPAVHCFKGGQPNRRGDPTMPGLRISRV